ncbi:hypothetical protein B484DRAFT_425942, partial [Ochromonadaceae sp. CCMP2298]
MDSDDMFDAAQEHQWACMRARGCSEAEVERARLFKRSKEDVCLYQQIVKLRAWESDPSLSFASSYMRLSQAYEGVNRRFDAVRCLDQAHTIDPAHPGVTLALAKLLFRDDQKDRCLQLCEEVFRQHAGQRGEGGEG